MYPDTPIGNRQVALQPVYDLLAPYLGKPGLIPGTPAWAALDDHDPAKWSAVLWSAIWWVVAEDARQAAMAEASKAVAAAADWPGIAREVTQLHNARHAGVRIERRSA